MIDLDPAQLAEVKRILREKVPDYEVRAFGSRVTGSARKYSDLDLALVPNEKVDWRVIEELKDAFSESNLAIMVDVLDLNGVSESFRKIIEDRCEVIFRPETEERRTRP